MLGEDNSGSCTKGGRVAAVVAWSGPTDLTKLKTGAGACLRTVGFCGNPGLASLIPALLERYLGCSEASCPRKWSDASPIDHVSNAASPMALFNSAKEVVPLDQVQALARALTAARVPNKLITYPGSAHAEAYGTKALPVSVSFLARYLEGSNSPG
jgi:acetyl esterase/lipase